MQTQDKLVIPFFVVANPWEKKSATNASNLETRQTVPGTVPKYERDRTYPNPV